VTWAWLEGWLISNDGGRYFFWVKLSGQAYKRPNSSSRNRLVIYYQDVVAIRIGTQCPISQFTYLSLFEPVLPLLPPSGESSFNEAQFFAINQSSHAMTALKRSVQDVCIAQVRI
jgi:hypothetical protein